MAEFALGWQTPAAERIEALFRADDGARALVWYGSRAAGDSDEWSDVDALVVLDEDAIGRYHPDRGWLGFLGPEIAARRSRPGATPTAGCGFTGRCSRGSAAPISS